MTIVTVIAVATMVVTIILATMWCAAMRRVHRMLLDDDAR